MFIVQYNSITLHIDVIKHLLLAFDRELGILVTKEFQKWKNTMSAKIFGFLELEKIYTRNKN